MYFSFLESSEFENEWIIYEFKIYLIHKEKHPMTPFLYPFNILFNFASITMCIYSSKLKISTQKANKLAHKGFAPTGRKYGGRKF